MAESRKTTEEFHSYIVLGSTFQIESRYKILDPIGQGAYGIVCAAKDEKHQAMVAIKKMENVFEHNTFIKRTLREIKLLRLLRHENIIRLRKLLRPRDAKQFEDLYAVFDIMETDLASIVKSPQPLSEDHVQFFLYQILRGMKYIHSANVIHRDLKPRNLLVNSNCDLKICDFGLARVDFVDMQWKVSNMTDYIATRWYRAPEVILSWDKYTKAIDVWSIGCIMAELLGRKPLFPGKDSQHQMELIIDIMGSPPQALHSRIRDPDARAFLEAVGHHPAQRLDHLFPDASPTAIDLLGRMLCLDPDKRITVEEALQHPYMHTLHCPEDEPSCKSLSKIHFEFERHMLTTEDFRELIVNEIKHYYHRPSDGSSSRRRRSARAVAESKAAAAAGNSAAPPTSSTSSALDDMSSVRDALPATTKK